MSIRKVSKDGMSMGFLENTRQGMAKVEQDFGEQIQKVQRQMVHQELESLMKDIDKQGKVLGETLNIKDLKKFKNLIQKFFDYAVNNMYHLKEQTGWDRRGRHKIYTVVETVNKELENLTEMVLDEQKDNISVLSKMDEIRGMLFDIYS